MNMVNNINIPGKEGGDIFIEVIFVLVEIILLALGSFIQLKIVSICVKEKHITWQIDITYAVGMMITFPFATIFSTITDYVPDLHLYMGVWICYIHAIGWLYGVYLIMLHSLAVSFMKYIFIVKRATPIPSRDEKTKKLFFIVTLMLPLFLSISTTMAYDFESVSSLIRCFGLKEELSNKYNTTTGPIERMFLCKLDGSGNAQSSITGLFVAKQVFCTLKMVLVLVLVSNIPEAYHYAKIFKKMKR